MKVSTAIYAFLSAFQLVAASPIISLEKRATLASQEDLQHTISFFETTAVAAAASVNSSELSTVTEDGFRRVHDVISGKTAIMGVTVEDHASAKYLVLPRIWGPWCKIINCKEGSTPLPWPKCDPRLCDPVEDILGCHFGFCGLRNPSGPIFPINPVVDPVDPDFALDKLNKWATRSAPLELLETPQLEAEDIGQLVSGLGYLAVSWRYSFEQQLATSSKAMSIRSPPSDRGPEKRQVPELVFLAYLLYTLL